MKRFLGPVLALVTACGADAGTNPAPSSGVDSTNPAKPSGSSSTTTPPAPPPPPPLTDAGAPPDTVKPVANPIRFVAMGDTGTGSDEQTKVGNTISAICKDRGCDFVSLLGDNLYDSGATSVDDPIWQAAFETPYAAIDLDFYAVLGNHDYGHGGLGTDFGKGKNEVEYTAKSKKWKMPAAYYHFSPEKSGGGLEFFALDTNMALFGMDKEQRPDMAKWLADSKAEWKIALGHHPYLSNGKHGNAGNYDKVPWNGSNVKAYLDDVVCGKVDLYLSGHDHSRQWLNQSCKGTELAVSGAGAKATELGGTNPSLFESLELGFLYIVIDGKTLTAEFIDENGQTEFTHVIKKP